LAIGYWLLADFASPLPRLSYCLPANREEP
jgi:hypothetical protein